MALLDRYGRMVADWPLERHRRAPREAARTASRGLPSVKCAANNLVLQPEILCVFVGRAPALLLRPGVTQENSAVVWPAWVTSFVSSTLTLCKTAKRASKRHALKFRGANLFLGKDGTRTPGLEASRRTFRRSTPNRMRKKARCQRPHQTPEAALCAEKP